MLRGTRRAVPCFQATPSKSELDGDARVANLLHRCAGVLIIGERGANVPSLLDKNITYRGTIPASIPSHSSLVTIISMNLLSGYSE